MKRILSLLLFFLSCAPAAADTGSEPAGGDTEPDTFGKVYYDRINSRVRVTPADSSFDIIYQTFTDWVLGGSARYGAYSAGLETSWPQPDSPTKARTSVLSTYFTVDFDHWRTELYWQHFKGFNLESVEEELGEEDTKPQRNDMHATLYGLKAQWVKSPSDVWIPGQSLLLETEPGFGFSFISGTRLTNIEVTSDRPLIPDQYREKFRGELETRGLENRMLGVDVGMAASWAGSRFRIGTALNLTYGAGYFRTYGTGYDNFGIAAALGAKLGASWRLKRAELGLTGVFDMQPMGTDTIYYQVDREVIQTYATIWL